MFEFLIWYFRIPMQSIHMTKVQSVHLKVRSMIPQKHQIRSYRLPPGVTINLHAQTMPSYSPLGTTTKCHGRESDWLIIFLILNLKKLAKRKERNLQALRENEDELPLLQKPKPNATRKQKILKMQFQRAHGSISSRFMDPFSSRTPVFYQKSISICMIHAVWRHFMRHVSWAMPNLPWF